MSLKLGNNLIAGIPILKNELPSQSGQSGKFLTTDGSAVSWEDVDALPDQTGKNGKYLKTNGTTATWEDAASTTTITYWTDD